MIILQIFTIAVALFVAIIGLLQWITANNKMAIDLFEKRFATYEELRKIISQHLTSGDLTNEMMYDFISATNRARFLFGPEVDAYLKNTYGDLLRANFIYGPGAPPRQATEADQQRLAEILDRLNDFYKESDKLFAPYMAMTDKIYLFRWRHWTRILLDHPTAP